jgi:hypothetical protein
MKFVYLVLTLVAAVSFKAQQAYNYTVDLNVVKDDRVKVTLQAPTLSENEIDFLFPAMVPGTYEIYDFGRFISGLTAVGKNGTEIKVQKVNANTYRISPATALQSISYYVDDTFDPSKLLTTDSMGVAPANTTFLAKIKMRLRLNPSSVRKQLLLMVPSLGKLHQSPSKVAQAIS